MEGEYPELRAQACKLLSLMAVRGGENGAISKAATDICLEEGFDDVEVIDEAAMLAKLMAESLTQEKAKRVRRDTNKAQRDRAKKRSVIEGTDTETTRDLVDRFEKTIWDGVVKGMSPDSLAKMTGLSTRRVQHIIRKIRNKHADQVHAAVRKTRAEGTSIKQIADSFELTELDVVDILGPAKPDDV